MEQSFDQRTKTMLLEVVGSKASELSTLMEDVEFLENETTMRMDSCAMPSFNCVRLATKCTKRLWVHGFAYYAMSDAFTSSIDGGRLIPDGNQLQYASHLLEWAVKEEHGHRMNCTEVYLYQPPRFVSETCSTNRIALYVTAADSLSKYGYASTALHELAHIYLNHVGTPTLADEIAADSEAAKWVLGGEYNDEEYLYRHFGVATKFLWMLSVFFNEKDDGPSHPPIWKRLIDALQPTVKSEEDPVWGFIVVCLVLHFHGFGIPVPIDLTGSKHSVEAMLLRFQEFNRRLKN